MRNLWIILCFHTHALQEKWGNRKMFSRIHFGGYVVLQVPFWGGAVALPVSHKTHRPLQQLLSCRTAVIGVH